MNEQQQFQQQRKGSLLWLWLIPLAVVGGLVLVVVGYYVLVAGAFSYADRPTPTVGDAMNATGQYYKAIQNHHYTSAYHYLEKNAPITVHRRSVIVDSVNTLATTSQALDTSDGVITSAIATDGSFEQGKNIVDLTMKVTRHGHSYDVHLKLEVVSGNWTILNADGI